MIGGEPMAIFQSTLSVRRATGIFESGVTVWNISIHALREESDLALGGGDAVVDISIHALREESDGNTATPVVNT